ncbi:CDP-alcohol phosphatidyltransferase family protein [Zhihengliuella sp.]|uniref:CDP-alcohol phosphatidyltransferase family protein n=1 Tax=Zhihengliuella sp. TaxID=1954483 RepID=UPI00281163D5|nr:CDP-alcohol phosphatidyltransferase family protein [Zhihengliuella sp.]
MRLFGAGTRDDVEYRVLDTFWTWPNIITVARFLLIPVFMWLVAVHEFGWATASLVLLGATDWIDGYVARRLNQVSTVGMWLDPLADRLALILVVVTFVVAGIAPAWAVYAIVVPDVVLLVNSLLLFRGVPDLPVSRVGKVRTAVLLVGAPLVLLAHVESLASAGLQAVATTVLALGCALHVIAAIGYLVAGHAKAKRERSGIYSPRTGGPWSG